MIDRYALLGIVGAGPRRQPAETHGDPLPQPTTVRDAEIAAFRAAVEAHRANVKAHNARVDAALARLWAGRR